MLSVLPYQTPSFCISRLFPGSSQAIPHRGSRPQSAFPAAPPQPEPIPHPAKPVPAPGALSLGDCRLPGELTGGRRSPRPGRPWPWRRAGGAAVPGALGWGPGPRAVGGGAALTCGAERSRAELLPLCGGRVRSPAQRTAAPDVGLGWQQKGGFLAQNFSQAPPLPPGRHKGRAAEGRPGGRLAPRPVGRGQRGPLGRG